MFRKELLRTPGNRIGVLSIREIEAEPWTVLPTGAPGQNRGHLVGWFESLLPLQQRDVDLERVPEEFGMFQPDMR